jgi:carbonic anhydrase/acetyltransferase-like protein (isoleucine patch superfamily)
MDPPGDQGGPGWRGDLYAVACGGDSLSLNRARPDQPASEVAESAVVIGHAHLGAGALLAQGVVLRARGGSVSVGNHSAVLENGVLVGWPDHPVEIGQRTVFGHRATVVGARVGNMCEIGNGAILLPGARLGDGCILGEGTLIPADTVIPDGTVLVGRPPHVLRTATDEDRARLAALRDGQVFLTDHPGATVTNAAEAGTHMGRLYAYRGVRPQMSPTAVLFDSAEITGDVVVGAGTIIGAGVKIIGDSHGPIRIGARVQILENTVLHLLPDNELVVEDDVVIGPGAMIHGCHLGAGTVVEPAAIVCDFSRVGAQSVVRAGACVKQRAHFPDRAVLDGFPADQIAVLDVAPDRPAWAFDPDDLPTPVRTAP